MTRLSVNVNKLATLRNSRGKNRPNVEAWAEKILDFGAHGITVHPRPDGRHIRFEDVLSLHQIITQRNSTGKTHVEFNVEGYPSEDILTLMEKIRPDQCTLVPDPPEALTSNAGWDLVGNEQQLSLILQRLRQVGVRSSLFVDPKMTSPAQTAALNRLKPDRIELYTEAYSEAFSAAYSDHSGDSLQSQVTETYVQLANLARQGDIGVNAGHDLNQSNLGYLLQKIPWLAEVSIGHALICEALEDGMQSTIAAYLKILQTT